MSNYKICNQVGWIQTIMRGKDWTFKVSDWKDTISKASDKDFIYIDPPYVGRHTDYYNNWTESDANALAQMLQNIPSGFAYSMWLENQYRKNEHLEKWFSRFPMFTFAHFYHVGPTESLRNAMQEALIVSHDHAMDADEGAALLRDFRICDEADEPEPELFAEL
ncbi:MAG: DNA adenine methylase [Negativicutes bacterium]|nr:DNA adenine methylase [Negativicutes bacterium]